MVKITVLSTRNKYSPIEHLSLDRIRVNRMALKQAASCVS